MGKNERLAYLKAIRLRYRRARKKIKVTILDEFCSVCGYNRRTRAGYIYLNDRSWPEAVMSIRTGKWSAPERKADVHQM